MSRYRNVCVKLPSFINDALEELVATRKYGSKSEAIRKAIVELLRRELWGDEQ